MIEGRKTLDSSQATYSNKTYLTILFSVFMGSITGSALNECLQNVYDERSFVEFITRRNDSLEPGLVTKIIRIVAQTYEFKYSINQLKKRRLNTVVSVIKAKGDEHSFAENYLELWSAAHPAIELEADHYSVLKSQGIHELTKVIRHEREGKVMTMEDRSSLAVFDTVSIS